MALISCPECEKFISDQASNCPHCGCQIKQMPADSRKGGAGRALAWVFGVIVAIPVLLIVGFYTRNKAIGPVGWAQDDTVKALKERMKDPDSMVIKSSFVVQKTDEKGDQLISMCGVVNGKNSFGGYTDGTRFASRSTYSKSLDVFFGIRSVQMEDPEQQRTAREVGMLSGFDKVYWNEWCVDAEHPPVVATNKSD
nr:orf196EGC129 [uncultured bacterium]